MRCITTRSGMEITLDGDLLAVLEAIDRELTDRHGLDSTYEDTMLEIRHVVGQMTEEERTSYLIESLFLNTVTYANEKAAAYVRKLTQE